MKIKNTKFFFGYAWSAAGFDINDETWGELRYFLSEYKWKQIACAMSLHQVLYSVYCPAIYKHPRISQNMLLLDNDVRQYVKNCIERMPINKRGFAIRFTNGHANWQYAHAYGRSHSTFSNDWTCDVEEAARRVKVKGASYFILPLWTENPVLLESERGQFSYRSYQLKAYPLRKLKPALDKARAQALRSANADEAKLIHDTSPSSLLNLQGNVYKLLEDKGDIITHLIENEGSWPAPWDDINMLKQYTTHSNVVNIRSGEKYDVYIGRTNEGLGAWGNPFLLRRYDMDSRFDCLLKYVSHIKERIDKNEVGLVEAIMNLRGKKLGCYCSPLPCHGDILAKLSEKDNREDMLEELQKIFQIIREEAWNG